MTDDDGASGGGGQAGRSSMTVHRGGADLPGLDAFKPKPTTTALLVQSNPDGADSRSSLGGTCRTPCTMAIATAGDLQ
jgi:hypothetical protein